MSEDQIKHALKVVIGELGHIPAIDVVLDECRDVLLQADVANELSNSKS